LRGINVSGKNKIRMIELKALFETLGYEAVTTYLQSGNVVFKTLTKATPGRLADDVEGLIKSTFNYDVPVLVITEKDINLVSQNNPFINNDKEDAVACYVTFTFDQIPKNIAGSLSLPPKETGRFHICDRVIYVHCPDGYGKTKINNQFFEKKLNTPATTRNWKTVNALRDLVLKHD
jgi:uncharacterized protein (DUF1697 family)